MRRERNTIAFFRKADGTLTGFRAQGHTGYAEAGEDIVCAAVSALTQSTLNGLKEVLGAPVMFNIDDRVPILEVELRSEATPAQVNKAQLLLITLLQALQAIETDHPRDVRVIFEERR